MKSLLKFKPFFNVVIHHNDQKPLAIRTQTQPVISFVLVFSILFLFFFTGTLCFFRELEINRKLSDRILELELSERVQKLLTHQIPITIQKSSSASAAETGNNIIPAKPTQIPKLGDIQVEQSGETSWVKLSLLPNGIGLAEGQLLVVLETEVPKIGTHTAQNSSRKKYFIYPNGKALDQLNSGELQEFEKKRFQFSKLLQTQIDFKIGKFLKPVAANVYLYDKEDNLIQHVRKQFEFLE